MDRAISQQLHFCRASNIKGFDSEQTSLALHPDLKLVFSKQKGKNIQKAGTTLTWQATDMLHSTELLIVLAIHEVCNYTWNLSWSQVVLNKTRLLFVVNWQSVKFWLPVCNLTVVSFSLSRKGHKRDSNQRLAV